MKHFAEPICRIILPVLLLTGCVESIVMDPHDEDLPVAVCCILRNPDPESFYSLTQTTNATLDIQRQTMTLNYVKGKSMENHIPVEEAEVCVRYENGPRKDPTGTIAFEHVGDGVWESDSVRIYPEADYFLSVLIPGKDTIRAKTTGLPDVQTATYAPPEVFEYDDKEAEEYFLRHPYYFHNNQKDIDCPVWVFAQEYTPEGWKDLKYLATDNPYADDFNISGKHLSDLTILGTQDQGDGTDARIREVFEASLKAMPNLQLHEGYIRMEKVDTSRTIFVSAGPIWYLNLESNGYYEYFDIQAGSKIVYDEEKKEYIRIPVYKQRRWTWNQYFRFHFHFVNSDLDEYLRSIYIREHKTDNYLTTLYTAPDIFSNIQGGVGIFGCENQLILFLRDPDPRSTFGENWRK